jgi:hypothetical protein
MLFRELNLILFETIRSTRIDCVGTIKRFQDDKVHVEPLGIERIKLYEMKTSQWKIGKSNFLHMHGQLQLIFWNEISVSYRLKFVEQHKDLREENFFFCVDAKHV